ncbi:MAG: hypothetical protein JSS30_06255 [Verrucomicrobia bacterium]|nr:hypothetical protein [Verrucomicrobiota bacterium]
MIIFSAILLPMIGIWIYQIAALRASDVNHLNEMIQERNIASAEVPSQTNQHRKQVRKDIWFSQSDGSRLHYQIASTGSLLSLTPIGNKFDIVESLQGVKCWMQDKLSSEGQQARLIEAETGLYRYTTQEFTANSVLLSLFKLPGHVLPLEPLESDEPFLSGIAKDISVIFSGKTPQFQAENFEATVVKE